MSGDPDVVVVGSGPNGLAAAVTLSAAGLRVLVIEGGPTIGGGCRTEELTRPGFRHDVCSAAHPLAVTSSFFRRFDLAARGVRFAGSDVVFAQPLDGGRAAVVSRSVDATAERLGRDAAAYRRLLGPLARDCGAVTDLLLSPIRRPPAQLNAGLAVFGMNGLRSAAGVARRFRTAEARALFAGAAAHGMMPLTRPPTGAVGLMLTGLAHAVGWPVAEGGSARITDAMAEAVVAAGGAIETGRWVRSLAELPPARAVLLDVAPRALLAIAGDRLPPRYRDALRRFRYGAGVCKVDFALSGPVPWANEACRRAGTLHLGGTWEEIAAAEAEIAAGQHPDAPYVLVTQPGVADPTRAPAGCHTLWTYCHVPAGSTVDMTGADRGADRALRPRLPRPDPGPAHADRGGRGSAQPELRRRGHRRRDADRLADRVPPGGPLEPVPHPGARPVPVLLVHPAAARRARPLRRTGRPDRAARRLRRPHPA